MNLYGKEKNIMNEIEFLHTPVLLQEVLQGLKINTNGTYVDATVGGAGHTIEIAKKLKNGKIFAFDRDPDAVLVAKKKLENYNAEVYNLNFREIKKVLDKVKVDGVLMDLGVSSFQLDNEKRGFSYLKEGPLDMRMSKSGKTAKSLIATATEKELIYILKNYGEEGFCKKIAKKIIERRKEKPIETTLELSKIINSVFPSKFKRDKNPSKKSFQAIRIAINDEINSLKEGISSVFSLLKPGARLLIISFHSLEDRIVKEFYKEKSSSCICPKDLPVCVCKKTKEARIITKKPIVPSKTEIEKNKRAASAKLRILEKI